MTRTAGRAGPRSTGLDSGTATPRVRSGARRLWRRTSAAVVCALLLAFGAARFAGGGATVAQTTCPPTPDVSPTADSQDLPPVGPHGPAQVCYPSGWNLVAGPASFLVPLWVWDPALAQYKQLQTGVQLPAGPEGETNGQGAWAFFSQPTAVAFTGVFPNDDPVSISLGAGRWQQIGNPFNLFQAAVCGPAAVFTYEPTTGGYVPNPSTLQIGQGAWVYAPTGGTLTLIAAGITSGCPGS